MTRPLVSRLECGHRQDCHRLATTAGWPSPWWIHSIEYRSATGRRHRRQSHAFLRLQCVFTNCKAVLLIEALAAGDFLTKALKQ